MKLSHKIAIWTVLIYGIYALSLDTAEFIFSRGVAAGMNLQTEIERGRYKNQSEVTAAIDGLAIASIDPDRVILNTQDSADWRVRMWNFICLTATPILLIAAIVALVKLKP